MDKLNSRLIGFSIAIVAVLACAETDLAQNPLATQPTTIPAGVLEHASVVVIGKIVTVRREGSFFLDSSFPRPRYSIKVERTLKGNDEAGFTLQMNSKKTLLAGQTYIFISDQAPIIGEYVDLSSPIEATPDAIQSVSQPLALAGTKVGPKRIVWMKQSGPAGNQPGGETPAELSVFGDGTFYWESFPRRRLYEGEAKHRGSGQTSAVQRAALQKALMEVGRDNVKSEPFMSLRWIDQNGEIQTRTHGAGGDIRINSLLNILQPNAFIP